MNKEILILVENMMLEFPITGAKAWILVEGFIESEDAHYALMEYIKSKLEEEKEEI